MLVDKPFENPLAKNRKQSKYNTTYYNTHNGALAEDGGRGLCVHVEGVLVARHTEGADGRLQCGWEVGRVDRKIGKGVKRETGRARVRRRTEETQLVSGTTPAQPATPSFTPFSTHTHTHTVPRLGTHVQIHTHV